MSETAAKDVLAIITLGSYSFLREQLTKTKKQVSNIEYLPFFLFCRF